MNRLLPTACSALLLLAAVPAFAGHGNGHGHGHGNDRGPDRGLIQAIGVPAPGHHDNGLHRGWAKGDRLPAIYLEPRYFITDYRAFRLEPPRPGYRWVRVPDGRIVLVAIASGVIADILLGH